MNALFRALPATDLCLTALHTVVPPIADLTSAPRPLVRHLVTAFLDNKRREIKEGHINDAATLQLPALLPALSTLVREGLRPHLRRVLNGTGVIIHTNMGRSVLALQAQAALAASCAGYSNVELDLKTGERGSRYSLVRDLICSLTGAEAAIVVNNNAAGVFLTLNALCEGREVIVSRGQLVEIGGSFRIPDVMTKSGAILREVGTTNRTHAADYSQAVNENTSAFLRVHTSNYRIVGFHKEVPLAELVALGRAHSLPVIEDLGSGSFIDFSPYGLPGEPTVQAVVADGADVVLFSGDKVLGGPQAGIIVGKKDYIERIRTNPLNRALRTDKLTLAALEATLRLYLDPELARQHIPTLRMMTATAQTLAKRAQALRSLLHRRLGDACSVTLRADSSRVGGGSFPECSLPTTLVCLQPHLGSATELKQKLLSTSPPVMGRLDDNAFCLDVRTLETSEYPLLVAALTYALA
ncbi:MAG: L-seryl-tRNA(Sec) selenium transferase [Desulfovibrionaceae bacterium]